ncbi:MAG: gliding motility-associated ABC transporter substrate-binding protein GldG [Chitinophagaceae bacterium]|nr:gliding motility-associated ABC transporter substrate-binding protein GldG [Chitinophagaceae bacterium]
MKKLLTSKYWWIYILIALVAVNYLASLIHFRVDLTQEKRYTLSQPTKRLLQGLNDPVSITVFLEGDMPAGFKKLSNSTEELLQEFKEWGKANIQFRFQKPGEGLHDTAKTNFIIYLDSLGLSPTNVRVQAKAGEAQEERLVYPGALISYKGSETAIDLLKGQSAYGGTNSLNNAEALLEYKFANAIEKITADSVPLIGYLIGNGEPLTYNVFDLIEHTLKTNYNFDFVPIDKINVIPLDFNAIVIVKPTEKFTDQQKLKIDQYIMHGGKVIWMIDNLYAEMDSLRQKQSDFIAYDRGLNLDDQLFKYGVRINKDLVQDLQSDKIPQVIGDYGGQPQIELVAWPYFPLLVASGEHPVSKNLDNVLSIFPNSIDTIKTPGVNKTILLSTSSNARTLSTPAIVSFNSLKTEEDMKTFNRSNIPVAVLLEGKFNSLYANRIPAALADTLATVYKQPFFASSSYNKMIVVSDADIVANVVTQNEGPKQMGYNQYTQRTYANKDFFLNSVEYLVNPSGILEARSKDFTLRLLDPKKVEESKTTWQMINIAIPVILILIFGFIYQTLRRKKYQ